MNSVNEHVATPASGSDEQADAKENLGVRAYKQLKNDIIKGAFRPDEKLRMSALKERYDLGIGPLREALSQLVAEHLVVAISQRGYRVAPMSLAELHDIYDARAQLEAMMLGLAIERGGDAWEADILAKSYQLSKVSEANTPDSLLEIWDARHSAFHTALVRGCRSPQLMKVRDGLFDKVQRYRHFWLKETVFSEQALDKKRQEHDALVEVTLAHRKEDAERMMRDHLMTPVPIITSVMQQQGIA
ncbi:DNA-binding transcriptional regulator CsiR [Halomonas llamarensis]|uniref:DNA-binding transcriptional regulator CsiR n=1 Tax=Halomonas llamarensis TaxID=2945104 RepID=A0ABT0SPI7_9GAMM|nr:DNA-binding transcriptional regulator CsiR [Halomonas llamarensis]MCL7929733.1 DNA-binding transcriptional regulator CsiR [Halomonas llamarensis]